MAPECTKMDVADEAWHFHAPLTPRPFSTFLSQTTLLPKRLTVSQMQEQNRAYLETNAQEQNKPFQPPESMLTPSVPALL